jgi:hypothetical protein
MDNKIHRGNIVVMDDDAIGGLLFGLLFFFFDPFRDWMRSEFHGRDYIPALTVGSRKFEVGGE